MSRNQKIITVLFLVIWVWSAINPVSPADWIIENIPVFAFVIFAVFARKIFRFSDTSYAFIAIFLALHLMGAHYTYEKVPFGFTLEDWLGSTRNMYDRLVHFSFGFLLLLPARELLRSFVTVPRSWSYFFSISAILAGAALYEIFEWIAASFLAPALSIAFIGSQGDIWDTQKDMAMALFGALAMVVVVVLRKRYKSF